MINNFKDEVDKGLSNVNKTLSSKYFYDKKGDSIFVEIMNMPEYYLTNAELDIFKNQTQDIIDSLQLEKDTFFELVELGAGDGTKTKHLLKKLDDDVGIQNYWIHKKDKQVQYHKIKSIDWQLDKNETVEKLFFKLHYPCHSFVIVDNFSKNYISFFGEYHSQQIVVFVKEMSKSQ